MPDTLEMTTQAHLQLLDVLIELARITRDNAQTKLDRFQRERDHVISEMGGKQ